MTVSVVQRPYGFQASKYALSGPIQKIFTFCPLDIRNLLMTGLFKAELYVKIKQKQPKPKQQKQHKTKKKREKYHTAHQKPTVYTEMLQNKEQGTINLFIVDSSPKLNPLLRDTNSCRKLYKT